MNRRKAITTQAAALDCHRRAKSGRRVSRQRTGLSETGREVDLAGVKATRGGGGRSDGEVVKAGGAGDGKYVVGAGTGAAPLDSDSRRATRRRLSAASIVKIAANPV